MSSVTVRKPGKKSGGVQLRAHRLPSSSHARRANVGSRHGPVCFGLPGQLDHPLSGGQTGRLKNCRLGSRKDAAGEAGVVDRQRAAKDSRCRLSKDDYIPPKAHGRNDLQHYKRVAWLAAMKASKFEIGTLRAICGMTAQELVDWREFNAMYQFVMRCILRDFDSDEPAVIYVFSRQQADYLQRRLGGVVEKIDDVVLDRPARCFDAEGAMTPAERKKIGYWRAKMIEAGVADVRDLPNGGKLTEREVRLVNRTSMSAIAARALDHDGSNAE